MSATLASCLHCHRSSWTLALFGWCPWCKHSQNGTETP